MPSESSLHRGGSGRSARLGPGVGRAPGCRLGLVGCVQRPRWPEGDGRQRDRRPVRLAAGAGRTHARNRRRRRGLCRDQRAGGGDEADARGLRGGRAERDIRCHGEPRPPSADGPPCSSVSADAPWLARGLPPVRRRPPGRPQGDVGGCLPPHRCGPPGRSGAPACPSAVGALESKVAAAGAGDAPRPDWGRRHRPGPRAAEGRRAGRARVGRGPDRSGSGPGRSRTLRRGRRHPEPPSGRPGQPARGPRAPLGGSVGTRKSGRRVSDRTGVPAPVAARAGGARLLRRPAHPLGQSRQGHVPGVRLQCPRELHGEPARGQRHGTGDSR